MEKAPENDFILVAFGRKFMRKALSPGSRVETADAQAVFVLRPVLINLSYFQTEPVGAKTEPNCTVKIPTADKEKRRTIKNQQNESDPNWWI